MAEPTTYAGLVASIENYTQRSDAQFVDQINTFILFGQKRIARELKILGLQTYVTGNFAASNGVVTKPARWLETISVNWGDGSGQMQSVTVGSGGTLYHEPVNIYSTGATAAGVTFSVLTLNGVITQVAVNNPGSGLTATSPPTLTASGAGGIGSGATLTPVIGTANVVRNFLLPRSYEWCREYWPNPTQTGEPRFYADYGFSNWLIVPTPSAASPIEIAYYQLDNPITSVNQTNWLTDNASDLLLYACLVETAPFLKDDDRIQTWNAAFQNIAKGYAIEDVERQEDRSQVRRAS
jgi:hypothetical protein